MFFGVLPGCVLAVDVPVNFGSIQGTFDLITPTGFHYPASFGSFSIANSGFSTVSLGPYALSSFNVGGLENFPDIVFSGFNNSFSVPVSFQASGLELTELLIDWEPLPRFLAFRDFVFSPGIVNSPSFFDYVPLSMYVSGTLTVSFSDGTSKTISVSNVSANRLSFSAKKDNRTHMFNLASDNAFDMSTDNSFKMSSKAFDISGSNNLSISGGSVVAPVSGEVSGKASLPRSLTADIKASGTANFGSRGYTTLIRTQRFPGATDYQTDNSIAFNTAVSGNIEHYFNIYASRLLFSVLGGTINMERAVITFAEDTMLYISAILKNAKVDSFTLSKANFSAKNNNVSVLSGSSSVENSDVEALVEISRAEPFVTVSSFSFTGTLTSVRTRFDHPLDMSDLSFSFDSGTNMNPTRFNNGVSIIFYPYVTYGDKEGVLAHMASTLDGIYSALRFDLPLTIRRLLIPTEEEVSDVVEDAVEDIKNNAGGLGEAVKIVDTEFKEIQSAISSSKKAPVIFPAFDINIFGYQVTLWDDIDFAPFLNNELVRLIMTPAELMLMYILATLLVRHMYLMWVCITSGSSYFAFLKGLHSDL